MGMIESLDSYTHKVRGRGKGGGIEWSGDGQKLFFPGTLKFGKIDTIIDAIDNG